MHALQVSKVIMLEDSPRNLSNKMFKSSSESSGGESSSQIWLVLFSGVILLSLLVNILFFSAIVCGRGKTGHRFSLDKS
jgi:hypothetical protein